MKKKITYIILIIISLLFLYQNMYYIYDRVKVMIISKQYTCFYNVVSLDNKYNDIVNNVKNYFSNFWTEIKTFFIWLYKVLISADALIIYTYIIQMLMFIRLTLSIWVSGKCLSFRTSKLACMLNFIMIKLLSLILYIKTFLKQNKKKCTHIILWCSGIGELVVFELVVFFIYYMYTVFTLTSYKLIFGVFKWIIVNVVNFFMFEHPAKIILLLLTIFILISIYFGKKKLEKNWKQFKYFVDDAESANILSGAPGTGKTSTGVNAQFAQTELYYDYYVRELMDFEILHPEINFAYIRLIAKIYFFDITSEEVEVIFKNNQYVLCDLINIMPYMNDELIRMLFNMYYRGSCILSGTPLKDPYTKATSTNGYARKLDYNTLRFFEKIDKLPFEDDTCTFFDEFDKEWNSHTAQSEVNKAGIHVFFSYVRHLGTKAWMTCQGLGQGLKNIKVCAGKFFWLYDKKTKMPILIKLVYKPILWLDIFLSKTIRDYLGTRDRTGKWTFRRGTFKYKRNDVGFLYQILKWCCCGTHKLSSYFQNYYYYKIYAECSYDPEGRIKETLTYNINFCDFYDNQGVVYNSTQFKAFYNDFKRVLEERTHEVQSIQMFEAWTSLEPTMEEYNQTNQSVIKKIYDAQFNNENKK